MSELSIERYIEEVTKVNRKLQQDGEIDQKDGVTALAACFALIREREARNITHQPVGKSVEAEQLQNIIDVIENWLEWDRNNRRSEALKTDDGTYIMALPVPYWPSHGQFANWINIFKNAAKKLSTTERESREPLRRILKKVHELGAGKIYQPRVVVRKEVCDIINAEITEIEDEKP